VEPEKKVEGRIFCISWPEEVMRDRGPQGPESRLGFLRLVRGGQGQSWEVGVGRKHGGGEYGSKGCGSKRVEWLMKATWKNMGGMCVGERSRQCSGRCKQEGAVRFVPWQRGPVGRGMKKGRRAGLRRKPKDQVGKCSEEFPQGRTARKRKK